jgi:hypothetical protein
MYDARKELEKLKVMRSLVSQVSRTKRDAPRVKRGLFNIIGKVSHSLFGILGSEDEEFITVKSLN